MSSWILLPVFLPILAGAALLIPMPGRKKEKELHLFVLVFLVISAILSLAAGRAGEGSVTLFYLMKDIPVYFQVDSLGGLFAAFMSIVWVLTGIYAFTYMKHEGKQRRFFGYYLIVYGVLVGLYFSGNLVTMYLFYELMSLTSVPLVLHNGSKEAIMASLKYLFYSMCGAYMGLFGIFFLYKYCDTLQFIPGGSLNLTLASGHEGILLLACFVLLLGFGVKAGMLPFHAWLPTAHPAAPPRRRPFCPVLL